MLIVYCDKCGVRVDEADLRSGAASKSGDTHTLCAKCTAENAPARAPHRTGTLRTVSAAPPAAAPSARTSKAVARTQARPEHETVRAASVSGQLRATTSARTAAGPSSQTRIIVAGVFAGVGLAVLVGALAMKRSAPSSAAAAKTERQPTKPADPAPPQRDAATGGTPAGSTRPPATAPITTPDASSKPATEPAPPQQPDRAQKVAREMEDVRSLAGASRLEAAKAYFRDNPDDPFTYHDKLQDVIRTYRSTPAGAEAAKLAAELKLPDDSEPPPDEAAWQQAVNLLPLIDPQKDAVAGSWKTEGDKLTIQSAPMARLEIPYEPPEEYDFRVTFARQSGNEDVNQLLAHAGRAFFWSMGCEKNTAFGFEQVDGANAFANRTAVRQDPAVENGRVYTSLVQVRKHVVRAWLDGKLIRELRTNYKNLGMRKDWALRRDSVLGLGAHQSTVVFQSIQLREVAGKGRPAR
ncbi:MAG: hypothetical protein NTW87_10325 [Planctomycetota bacterium]|nr:hypothetical protein [Planctomycetota bacterium]